MKKKIFLTLFLVIAMMLTLVLVASAETPSLYIEFKVKLSGATDYTTAYTKNVNSAANPKFSFNENFYSDIDFTQPIGKSTIVGIDISEAVTRATANSNTGTIKELVSSSTALTTVEEIKFPKASTFTTIPSNCCKNWTALKTIDFGNANKISDNGFLGTAIVELTIPTTLTRINNNSFNSCAQLKKLTILGTTDFGDSAVFGKCTALTDVDLGSITIVQGSLFNGCSSLTSITLPETVTKIGSTAFMNTGLTSLHIPASCTEIGVQMVEGLKNFTTITFAENSQLKKIGHRAFKDSGLTAIDLPEGIEEIAYSAFEGSALTSIEFPASLKTLSYSVLSSCKSLTSVSFADGFNIENWTCQGMFFYCSSLTSVELPACTKVITDKAFEGASITSITIPANVTEIGYRAFFGCKTLATIDFESDNTLTTVGKEALYNVPAPLPLELFSSVTSVGESAFNGCTGITSIVIPKGTTSITKSAYSGCKNLTTVIFEDPDSLTTIGDSAFNGCTSLTNIDIPNKVKTIESNAFRSTGLTRIFIPSSVTSIGSYAFHTTKATSLEFESRTTELSLGNVGVFQNNQSLVSITLPEGITAIGQECFTGAVVVEIVIPDSVKSIGSTAFGNCKKLTSITINPTSSLVSIGSNAFKNTSIKSFYFPNSLTSIGNHAFAYNENKSLVALENFENCGLTSIPNGLFRQCGGLKTIKFPYGITELNGSELFTYCDVDTIILPQTLTTISKAIEANSIGKIIFAAPEGTALPANAPSTTVEYVNYCETYFAGAHKETSEVTLVWLDKNGNAGEEFLSYLKVACPCGRSCGDETVIETLAPLFVDRGFAYGPNSMLQGIAVDRELLTEYGKYFTGIKYGLVAAAKSAQTSASIINANGEGVNGYVAAVDYTERDYDLFEMNLFGISENYQATEFFFGAYVIANGQVYYIHNGTTNNEAQAITYNDVVVIVDALIPENKEEEALA